MKLAISKSHFRKKKSKKRNPIWSAEIEAIWLASDKNHKIAYVEILELIPRKFSKNDAYTQKLSA